MRLGGVQLVYESTCFLAWGVIFDRRKDGGVVCVFSNFSAGENVCRYMCVYTHAHSHTTQMGYSDVSPGVGMRHLERPKNPDGLNLEIHIFVYVYKVHMCIYMLRGGMRSWTDCFFLLRKVEDVTTISKPQSLTSVRIKDCTLRVPNKTTTLFLSKQ